jgi:hypothetical protein
MADDAADVTWGVRTATNDQGTDRKNFSYEIDPGTSVTDALIVSNHDTTELDLDLYGADGFTTSSGQLDVVTSDAVSVAVGAWVSFGVDHIVIPAGESVETPFTVTVPDNATPGDYAGGVITSLQEPGQDEGITVDRRLGIRIHLRVGGELAPSLAIDKARIDYTGTPNPFGLGDATVSYTLRNTGNARLAAGQAVTVTGPFGMLPIAADAIEAAPELLPGESWTVKVPVAGVFPALMMTATVTATPSVIGGDGTTSAVDAVEATVSTAAVPWTLLLVLLLVVVAALATRLLLRRRRRQRALHEDARVAEAVEKALREQQSVDA